MTNNKELTAVDFFYDEVWACFSSNLSWSECELLKKIKEQAKEMEKEQHRVTAQDFYYASHSFKNFEQYYNETYEGDKQ